MRDNVFKEVRERVAAEDAAKFYGIEFDRQGKAARCPFHPDRHPSMTFKNGRYRCWACGASGNSIDFTAELLNLTPIEAVRKMNLDFNLALPLDKPPSKAEQAVAQRRRENNDTSQEFEERWGGLIQRLNQCFRVGHLALMSLETPADFDRLTDAQVLAIRQQAYVEYLADTLTIDDMAVQIHFFRERRQIEQLCEKILSSTQMKSDVA